MEEKSQLSLRPLNPDAPPDPREIDAALDDARDAGVGLTRDEAAIEAFGLSADEVRVLAYADERVLAVLRKIYRMKVDGTLDAIAGGGALDDAALARLAREYQTWQAVLDDLEQFPRACRDVVRAGNEG